MRPQLRVVPESLITPILDEAKRILAEIGVEVRGARLRARVKAEVERLLGAYVSPSTDPRIDAEMLRLMKAGLTTDAPLPETLPPVEVSAAGAADARERRGRGRRREQT